MSGLSDALRIALGGLSGGLQGYGQKQEDLEKKRQQALLEQRQAAADALAKDAAERQRMSFELGMRKEGYTKGSPMPYTFNAGGPTSAMGNTAANALNVMQRMTGVGDYYKTGLSEEEQKDKRLMDQKRAELERANIDLQAAAPGLAKEYNIPVSEAVARLRAGVPVSQWGNSALERQMKSAQIQKLLADAARDRAAAREGPTEDDLNAALAVFNTRGLTGGSVLSDTFLRLRAGGDRREPRRLMYDIINGIEQSGKTGGMSLMGKGKEGTVRRPMALPPGAPVKADATAVKSQKEDEDFRKLYDSYNALPNRK